MRAKKSLGQNFLMHASTAERIADAAGLSKDDAVLEIGPGTGMLTKPLLARAARVIAIEADGELIDSLKETFANEAGIGKLELIHADIREFDPERLPEHYALVANIPYYITGEIIRSFLETPRKPVSMTLLVQKEVAERIARLDPKKPKESLLSLAVKAYGEPKYCFTVPKGAFVPAPKVDSAVLHIGNIRKDAFASDKEEKFFFDMLHAAFSHKRKQVRKNLESLFPPETVAATLAEHAIEGNTRAEDLSLADWKRLASSFSKKLS